MSSIALVGGKVITVDGNKSEAEALLIVDGRIEAVGSSAEISAMAKAKGIEQLDLAGKTVVPGLHDCHVHVMGTGHNALGIDVYDCKSVGEVLALVKKAAEEYPKDRWIFCKRLDESRLSEGRPPTLCELDEVAPEHNVYMVDRGWHYTLVNTRAFNEFGLKADTPGVRRTKDGSVSGRLHEQANNQAKMAFFEKQSTEQRRAAIMYTSTFAASKGVTTLHAMEGGRLFTDSDIPVVLDMLDKIPGRMTLYWAIEDIDAVKEKGLPIWGGDIVLDGSIGSRTAAFPTPYSDDDSTCGALLMESVEVERLIKEAFDAELQIAFHAIGQSAVTQALDCLENVLKHTEKTDHRFRIEHFGFPTDEDVERAGRLGAVVSSQPSFTFLRGGPGTVYNQRLGTEREKKGYPHRRMLDAGIVIGGGSDSDVTPIDPLLGIHSAVNPPYAENAVTPYEALKMFTFDAAFIALEEAEKGSIEPNKLGDVTVLGDNPLTCDKAAIKDIPVELTIVGGKVVYSR